MVKHVKFYLTVVQFSLVYKNIFPMQFEYKINISLIATRQLIIN